MYELHARRGGRVIRVEVDEGQMVAEEDEIALLESDDGPFMVVTEVPGVVRELYVEAGHTIGAGAVVALIDEA